MKRMFFIMAVVLIGISNLSAQFLPTNRTVNLNDIWQSGFFDTDNNTLNTPYPGWFKGINIGYVGNNVNNKENSQIMIAYATEYPMMYIRNTNSNGEGAWVKVIHDHGSQLIKGDLTVAGQINAREIQVTVNAGADYVFHPEYNLKDLSEVKTFIDKNKHLPDIPSEKEMQDNGLNMNEFQIKLLQKIEELTLYTIQQQKMIEDLQLEIKGIKSKKEN